LPHVAKAVALNTALTGPYDYMNEKMWICFGDIDDVNRMV
jgi:hypothetical protein